MGLKEKLRDLARTTLPDATAGSDQSKEPQA